MKVCIVGASGKLGRYMVQHCLDRGYEVVGVCREKSVEKLDPWKDRITIVPGPTNDRGVIQRAVEGCDGVLTVLVPWGVHDYSSGTAAGRNAVGHAGLSFLDRKEAGFDLRPEHQRP
jgi:nucleoside-diphosphate-sugar epimerase